VDPGRVWPDPDPTLKKTDKIIFWNFSIYVIHIREAEKKILH